eukprot:910125-Prorocentrum_minimum.AAC.1
MARYRLSSPHYAGVREHLGVEFSNSPVAKGPIKGLMAVWSPSDPLRSRSQFWPLYCPTMSSVMWQGSLTYWGSQGSLTYWGSPVQGAAAAGVAGGGRGGGGGGGGAPLPQGVVKPKHGRGGVGTAEHPPRPRNAGTPS